MKIVVCRDYEDMSNIGAEIVLKQLKKRKKNTLCAATGQSPIGLYTSMVDEYRQNPGLFKSLKIIKLDEWGGIPMDHPATCEMHLKSHLLTPLDIPPSRYLSFDSNAADPQMECIRIQGQLDAMQPINMCLLGMGTNGHLGFNEPAEVLNPHCHVAELTDESLHHNMIQSMKTKPKYGLTLGVSDILRAKKIILLITGKNKERVIDQFLKGGVSSSLPASVLREHANTTCLIDQHALALRT